MLIEIPDEMAQHFKYVCRAFTEDEAAMLLLELLAAIERGQDAEAVKCDWEMERAKRWLSQHGERLPLGLDELIKGV